jgi:gamma-glutamylcysteine synthetase
VQLSTDLKFNLMQVNLDFSSEQDMINKFRAGLALQPVGIGIIFYAGLLFVAFSPSCVYFTDCNCDICKFSL